ncbi:outer membrane protein [Tianweitania sediminis]|nr:outer membrane protein [Tianweitania sediminis]HEV7416369.1 outer membrane protein [Tianweitania sediminis]
MLPTRLLLAAGFMFASVAAQAADYDPPIVIDDIQEVVPVEVGSGWYLRGDVGYTFSSRYKNYERTGYVPDFEIGEDNTSLFGGAGFGYNITDYLRVDLTGGFLRREKAWGENIDPFDAAFSARSEIETSMAYGMVTGYIDLGTFAGFTPYVGAGAGMVYTHSKGYGDIRVPDNEAYFGDFKRDDFGFAYTLNAGMAYSLTQNLSLDVGYQYFNAPKADYFSFEKPGLYGQGLDFHQVKVGLRYDLW